MNKGILSESLQSKSVVDTITNKIIEAIIAGELNPGDKLPTEIELCSSLGVGRNSIREAIKKLEAYGIVYIKRADGTFVSESYSQKMLDPLLYGIILQNNKDEFIELRRVIDIGTLFLVIRIASQEDVSEIKDALEKLRETAAQKELSVAQILAADTAFHTAIAKAAHNEMLVSINDYITRITIPSRTHTVENIIKNNSLREFIKLHDQMFAVIEEKRARDIEIAVLNHYVYWEGTK